MSDLPTKGWRSDIDILVSENHSIFTLRFGVLKSPIGLNWLETQRRKFKCTYIHGNIQKERDRWVNTKIEKGVSYT